jgi:hypothetical protein
MMTRTVAIIIKAVLPSLKTGSGSAAAGAESTEASASRIVSAEDRAFIESKSSVAKPILKLNRLIQRILIKDNDNNSFFII